MWRPAVSLHGQLRKSQHSSPGPGARNGVRSHVWTNRRPRHVAVRDRRLHSEGAFIICKYPSSCKNASIFWGIYRSYLISQVNLHSWSSNQFWTILFHEWSAPWAKTEIYFVSSFLSSLYEQRQAIASVFGNRSIKVSWFPWTSSTSWFRYIFLLVFDETFLFLNVFDAFVGVLSSFVQLLLFPLQVSDRPEGADGGESSDLRWCVRGPRFQKTSSGGTTRRSENPPTLQRETVHHRFSALRSAHAVQLPVLVRRWALLKSLKDWSNLSSH